MRKQGFGLYEGGGRWGLHHIFHVLLIEQVEESTDRFKKFSLNFSIYTRDVNDSLAQE